MEEVGSYRVPEQGEKVTCGEGSGMVQAWLSQNVVKRAFILLDGL